MEAVIGLNFISTPTGVLSTPALPGSRRGTGRSPLTSRSPLTYWPWLSLTCTSMPTPRIAAIEHCEDHEAFIRQAGQKPELIVLAVLENSDLGDQPAEDRQRAIEAAARNWVHTVDVDTLDALAVADLIAGDMAAIGIELNAQGWQQVTPPRRWPTDLVLREAESYLQVERRLSRNSLVHTLKP